MTHSAKRAQIGARALDLAIGLGLFLAAWALRAAPAPFVTWDEPAWVYRSVAFLAALQRGDWAATLQVGHPGVLTMWGGALSLAWHRHVTGLVTAAQLQAIASTPWEVHDVALLRQLAALLPLAKGGGILLQAGLLAALYGLLRRLAGRWAALAAALLLLGDPFYLALARVLHLDALAAGWMLASLLALLCATHPGDDGLCRRHLWLILSGAAWGLALLTKTYALLALPAVGWLLWAAAWGQRDLAQRPGRAALVALGQALRAAGVWLLAGALACLALWPALWSIPGQALRAVAGLSVQYAAHEAEATATFFRGQAATQVGASFYPLAVWFRATPLALLGALLAILPGAARPGAVEPRRRMNGRLALALGGYALLYLALVSLSLKKFDRYALPALLTLDVLAALGWAWALQALWRQRAGAAAAATLALAVLQGALLLGPLYPAHYLAYYNPLAGGLRQAVRTLPVGWGEGIEAAASHLAAHPQAAQRTVATWALAGLAPLYPGEVLPLTPENLPQADAVLLYIADWQAQDPPARAFFQEREPTYVATVGGVPYAWVFENDYGQEALAALAAQACPGDLALANLPSTLPRRDQSAATWLLATADEADPLQRESALAAQLQAALGGRDQPVQVFYAALEAEAPRRQALRLLLAERGLLLERTPFEYGLLERYRLPAGVSFGALEPSQPLEAAFGDQLALTGFGLASPTVQYRQEAGLALRWRALQTPAQDYHLSLTLLDEAGQLWGQRDIPLEDAAGALTGSWVAGQEALTRVSLAVEAGTPPGDYALVARVYALGDLQPLSVTSPRALDSHALHLATLRVARAEVPPTAQELPIQQPFTATVGGEADLLGYSLDDADPMAGEDLTLTLFWRCLLQRASDEPILWEWTLEREGRVWQRWRLAPTGEGYPSNLWAPDEVLRYPYHLDLSPDLPSGEYALRLAPVGVASGRRLAEATTVVEALPVRALERLWQAPPMGYTQPARLGEEIALLGYDLATTLVRPGETVALTLYWQALRAPEEDYTVFVHLLDEGGALHGQRDRPPADGERPTSDWAAGEVVADDVLLPIPDDAPPGRYRLQVGLYLPASGERLPVLLDPDGAAVMDPERRILLDAALEIVP